MSPRISVVSRPVRTRFLYWRGVARANGSPRRPADLLTNPADTPMVTVDAPNNHDLFGSFAGRSFSYVVVICHPTSAANPRPDYALPTDRALPHMLRAGETPLWPDATTRFPVLLFSHGYGESPIESDYVLAMTVFASFGYVVVAPFHTDATFSDLQSLEGFLDFAYLVTHLEQFNAMQALRPLALSAGLDYVLGQPQWRDRIDATQVGGFGASMGAESMLLLGGAELTKTVLQASERVTLDPRLKAAVGYVPYFGQIGFSAFGHFEEGLDGVTMSFLGIAGTADTTAPLSETLRGMNRLAGPRELVAHQRREARARHAVDSRHLHVVGDLPGCGGSRRSRSARKAPRHDERRRRRRRPRARFRTTVRRRSRRPRSISRDCGGGLPRARKPAGASISRTRAT